MTLQAHIVYQSFKITVVDIEWSDSRRVKIMKEQTIVNPFTKEVL